MYEKKRGNGIRREGREREGNREGKGVGRKRSRERVIAIRRVSSSKRVWASGGVNGRKREKEKGRERKQNSRKNREKWEMGKGNENRKKWDKINLKIQNVIHVDFEDCT